MSSKPGYVYKTTPYPHQDKVFQQSRDLENFALLMEQGTGKTKVIIDTAAWLFERGKLDSLMVIAPNGVHLNWVRNEIPDHLPERIPWYGVAWNSSNRTKRYNRSLVRLFDSRHELKVFTMNVEAMSAKRGHQVAKDFLDRYPRAMCVVDESSKIKNPKAKRTKNIVNLRKRAEYRRILTGTPVTQSPLDVYPQFYFLHPSIIGFTSFYAFKHHYAKVVQRPAIDGSGRTYKYEDIVGYQHLAELRERTAAHSFRVTKAESLKDLPPKIYTQTPVWMSKAQSKLYNKLASDFLLEVQGEELPIPMVLTRLLRFQQITGGFVTTEAGETVPIDTVWTPKLAALMDDLETLPSDESAIIWARFVPEIKMLLKALRKEYGYDAAGAYYGETSSKDRAELIDRFQQKKTRFFVGNPQAAGMGLTLHAASTVYYYSNDFSLENRMQSEDRAHRIGQKKNVVYKDIVCVNTIDERVLKVLREKRNLADIVTGDNIRSLISSV